MIWLHYQKRNIEMSSGGRRVGAGRKSKFGEKTVVLRVPESMLESVQNHLITLHNQNEIVTKSLDNATNSKDYVTESKQLAQIQEIINKYQENATDSPRWVQAKNLLKELDLILNNKLVK